MLLLIMMMIRRTTRRKGEEVGMSGRRPHGVVGAYLHSSAHRQRGRCAHSKARQVPDNDFAIGADCSRVAFPRRRFVSGFAKFELLLAVAPATDSSFVSARRGCSRELGNQTECRGRVRKRVVEAAPSHFYHQLCFLCR